MKALHCFCILLSVFMMACTQNSVINEGSVNNATENIMKETTVITVKEIENLSIPWDETFGDFTSELQITPEMAKIIADTIFEELKPDIMEKTYSIVSTVKDNDIIVVTRVTNEMQLGGDFNIAIDIYTGEILKMWAGE